MINNEIVPDFDDEKDESLKIRLQIAPDTENCLILVLHGYIDTYNSSYFQKRVQRAIEEGYTRLIFHCSGLSYVSSTGIGSFTALLKTVKPLGGDLVLLEVQPKVYEVLQLLGFSQFFHIQPTLEDAIAFFHDEKEESSDMDVFPVVFSCPVCSKKLKATKSGRFRCSECKTVIEINTEGVVTLG